VRAGCNCLAGNNVSGAAAANGVNGSMVLVEEAVSFELLIEGEHCTFRLGLDVSSSTAAAKKDI
jgi:hypothetical protein